VAVFAEPLLAAHDRSRFEIFCYQNYPRGDEITARFAALADHFGSIASMSDAEVAQRIRADAIDILVDLNGHTAHNRLPLFFLKPAPVQATWLGYLGTTGVPTIDYRLTDVFTDPPGGLEPAGVEALWRLPQTQWCYRPYAEAPEVGPLPAATAHAITFVCMNHATKISRTALSLWARILEAVPASRLLLLAAPYPGQRAQVLAFFAARGIAGERIEQVGEAPIATYLGRYLRADIALDSLPCAGGTTTCDALWMGVPVVSHGTTTPGKFPLIGNETVLDGILQAGGMNDRSNWRDVILVRPTNDGPGLVLNRGTGRKPYRAAASPQ
jgi:predicted O-linked N-acetylglucosamine transferase (SPINDLY family)